MSISIQKLYDLLYAEFGETGWWPADSPDEVIIGAVLTQNTAWKNVEMSIRKLKDVGIITLEDLAGVDAAHLQELIRSSGFFRQKSKRLINISRSILEKYGSIGNMVDCPTQELKDFLLSLEGIGQETMDCILLYVLDKAEFVVDKYTLRIFQRIGILENSSIADAKRVVEKGLKKDTARLKNMHGMLVELAKNSCRVKPLCESCAVKKGCYYGSRTI